MSRSVYLAGPITGLTYDEGQDWRTYATEQLAACGIEAFSPLRAKKYLRDFGQLDSGGSDACSYLNASTLSNPAGITARDRFDCTGRDVVLVNLLGAERVSIGTMIELGWADATRTPIVLVIEPGNVHAHAVVEAVAGFTVDSLQEGLKVVEAILLP